MKKTYLVAAVMVLALILVAWASRPVNDGNGDQNPGGDHPEVVQEVISKLKDTLGISADEIKVESIEQVEWPNACLGLAGEDEMCAEVITPGWKIVLSVAGDDYTFHTDLSANYIRQK